MSEALRRYLISIAGENPVDVKVVKVAPTVKGNTLLDTLYLGPFRLLFTRNRLESIRTGSKRSRVNTSYGLTSQNQLFILAAHAQSTRSCLSKLFKVPAKNKERNFSWTHDEMTLLVGVIINYKANKASNKMDWDTRKNNYEDVLAFLRSRRTISR